MKSIVAAALLAVVGVFASLPAWAGDLGVVLMHGKWGMTKPDNALGKLAARLEAKGIAVVTPEMPWSAKRNLEQGYEESMAEIDKAVADLKAQGASRIVVAGQSMGSNAALGYAARRDGLAGVMVLSPGHVPDLWGQKFAGDLAKARKMIADGKGAERSTFNDFNQGTGKEIEASAEDYLSWFDPDGPAVFPKNAKAIHAPLLWLVGSDDFIAGKGEAYAYADAPANPRNEYVVIDGANHGNAPIKGVKAVIKWLKRL